MKSKENLFGAYAVLLGVIVALSLGIFQAAYANARQDWVYVVLTLLGISVGFFSVGKDSKDTATFLIASVSLVIVGALGQTVISVGNFGIKVNVILDNLLIMFVPATIVVALKSVFSVASIK